MGKPTICIGENKDADQLRGNREADQRHCFRYSDSTIPPLLNSKISSFYLFFCSCTARFVSDLFGNHIVGFPTRRLICCSIISTNISISSSLVVTCSEPASVPDSSRSEEPPYYYSDDLTYTCDLGFELSSGDAIRTCTASGTWSGAAPTCSRTSASGI